MQSSSPLRLVTGDGAGGSGSGAFGNGPDAFAFEDRTASRRRWAIWAIVILAALVWHWLLFGLRPAWSPAAPPPRVDIQEIDPKKLEAVRKQWRDKALLLNKDKSKPSEAEPPKDARYQSDRNIRVEKEQRARDTQVMPKPGGRSAPQSKPKSETQPKVGNLGNLGVPLNLKPVTPEEQAEAQRQEGGDQAIHDPTLAEGAENLLNAEESIYYSFYSRLYESVGPIWASQINEVGRRQRIPPGEYVTTVDVVFDRDGNLLDIRWLRSSGHREFDAAVERSWRKILRFPNPPNGLLNAQGEVHTAWTFRVQVGAGGGGLQFLPPERNY